MNAERLRSSRPAEPIRARSPIFPEKKAGRLRVGLLHS